jgi:hypothetical protein
MEKCSSFERERVEVCQRTGYKVNEELDQFVLDGLAGGGTAQRYIPCFRLNSSISSTASLGPPD